MFQRSGSGFRRAIVMAASVAAFGAAMAGMTGGAAAGGKGGGYHEEYSTAAPNCSVDQNWSHYRKCGDTGSNHEAARAEPRREPPAIARPDIEPASTDASAPSND